MRVLVERVDGANDEHIVQRYPTILIAKQDVEAAGKQVVSQVDIVDGFGKVGRYWLTVRIEHGRPVASLSCNSKTLKKEVHTELKGSFK